MRGIDLGGQRFGRLVVKSRNGSRHGHARWDCICDCGRGTTVESSLLRNGGVKSCRCLRAEATAHGAARRGRKTPEYVVWVAMRQRCEHDPDYAGRGISVCAEWQSFDRFISDMGPRPSSVHSIERMDNNGNYEPWNCRWATMKEQASNTRRNILVTIGNDTMTLMQAVEKYRSRSEYNMIAQRFRSGWAIEKALGLST